MYKLLFISTIPTLAGHHLECVGSGSNGKLSVEVQEMRRKTRGKREHLSFSFPFFLLCFESIQKRFLFLKVFLSNSVLQTICRDCKEFWLDGFPAVEVVERFSRIFLSLVFLKSLILFYLMLDWLRFLSACCSCLEGVWDTHSMAWVVWHEHHLINNHQCVRRGVFLLRNNRLFFFHLYEMTVI